MDAKTRLILFAIFAILFVSIFALADPTGPDTINIWSNSTWSGSSSGTMINTSGGYISGVNMTSISQNSRWKAFVGHVSGSFTLDDAGGATIYDWTLSSISGEVYATRTSGAVAWANPIACATGPQITAEDTAMNHTGSDNITGTFTKTNDYAYTIAGASIGIGTCSSQNTYVDNSTQDTTFEEIVLYDGSNIVYATKIESNSPDYSGGAVYDFQMLVPENGADGFPGATAYYLYVELS